MSNLTIFKQAGAVSTASKRELSDLGKSLATVSNTRRIQTNTNGTFKRLVNGEQIGKAIRGEFNAIIVDALPKVSRTFYAGKYDPDAKPTLPDCWSNLGDKPEAAAGNPQASNCVSCPKNVSGSGDNGKGRACRFQRRIAVMIDGDDSGDVYQFNVPAKSLFGKGNGNVHPFESYVKFLIANGESPDGVVTNIAYNLDAETMELQFTPMRGISKEEEALVKEARNDPATRQLIVLSVAPQGETKAQPKLEEKPQPKITYSDEPDEDEEEEVEAPKKRASKSTEETAVPKADLANVLAVWGNDDDEDED
jgi:hypothetical protein